MGKINQLPKNIAELIAAGEVVERPASVVKELLENSIDAGATSVTVEIQNGGVRYIRITDNGCGIAREDVPLAFLSHATSKISAATDLDSIMTLGFRGEALASVAAVSKTEILTKTADEANGTRMVTEGGEQCLLDDAGCPCGTTIIIRDLFYNTPARMKFLKTDRAEGNAVAGIVDKIALSHPDISFRFIKDGKQQMFTPGNGDLRATVYAVFGKDFSENLIETNYNWNGLTVSGFVSAPFAARGTSSMQMFFVNGRYIKSRTAMAALSEAYKNSVMVGRYPSCVLFLQIAPELVDVNVHPAKTEVRFSNEKLIFDAVYYAAKNAITADNQRRQVHIAPPVQPKRDLLQTPQPKAEQAVFSEKLYSQKVSVPVKTAEKSAMQERPILKEAVMTLCSEETDSYTPKENNDFLLTMQSKSEGMPTVKTELPIAAEQSSPKKAEEVSAVKIEEVTEAEEKEIEITFSENPAEKPFKFLGEAFKAFIFAEYDGKLVIIDKHAAHERMLFNALKKNNGENGSQLLLRPVTVVLSKEEYSAVTENFEALRAAGFDIEDFGSGSVVVRACPLNLEKEDITGLITEAAGYLMKNKKDILPEKLDWIYHSVACRSAIKAGDKTSDYELLAFTKKLLADSSIRYCPHGRPVLIELSKHELDKQFGRA